MMLQIAGRGGMPLRPLLRYFLCIKALQFGLQGGPCGSCMMRREVWERKVGLSQLIP